MRDVVVTGMGIICGIGNDKMQVTKSLLENKVGIKKLKSFETKDFSTEYASEVTKLFTNSELPSGSDRSTIMAESAIREALKDSNILDDDLSQANLLYGTCNGGIHSIEEYKMDEIPTDKLHEYPFFQSADELAKLFGIGGQVETFNTACAASGNAISYGADLVENGRSDLVIAGGSDALSKVVFAGFDSLRALKDSPSSPYSKELGLSLGEGSAFVVLEPLEKVKNKHIYSQILGTGLSNDAYHATAPDPDGEGIGFSVSTALDRSGVSSDQIEYINTHGTGTKANDAAELNGLKKIFGKKKIEEVPLSSSKSYFGHNLGAAAAIEYVSTILLFEKGFLPATMNFTELRDGCKNINLIANGKKKQNWPKYFLKNNAAFGGHNCSIVSKNPSYIKKLDDRSAQRKSSVFINGFGFVYDNLYKQGFQNIFRQNDDVFKLKKFDKHLYARRMNQLSQSSIAAIVLSLRNSAFKTNMLKETNIGLCYGTGFGSLQSSKKYLSSIEEDGYDHASSIYFPDMVLNSTAGTISKQLGIKGYATSISSGGNEGSLALIAAYEAIKNDRQKFCIAASGEEASPLAQKISNSASYANKESGKHTIAHSELLSSKKSGSVLEMVNYRVNHCEISKVKENVLAPILEDIDLNDNVLLICNSGKIKEQEVLKYLGNYNLFFEPYPTDLLDQDFASFSFNEFLSNNKFKYLVTLESTENGNQAGIIFKK